MSDKEKELLKKANKTKTITIGEIDELYSDSDPKREDFLNELRKNNIELIYNDYSFNDVDLDVNSDVINEDVDDFIDDDYEESNDESNEEDSELDEDEELELTDDSNFYSQEEDYEYDNFDDLIQSKSSSINQNISVSDPVKMFLKEIGGIQLLKADEERELAKRVYDSMHILDEYNKKLESGYIPSKEEQDEMNKLYLDGEQAKKTLTEANLRLVVNIAKHFSNPDMEFADLIQEGSLGLAKAVIKFDYTKGFKFSTYATGWIKQAITRAIADQARTIRIPVHMNETINKLNKKERELTYELGRKPTVEETAEAMELPVEKILMIKRVSQKTKSLEDPVGEEDDSTYGDFVPDNDNPNPEEYTANESLKNELNNLLSNLSDREERVIRLRFGLIDGRTKTLEEVGREFNVTRERIRQIEAKALRKLRHPSRANKLKDYLK